MNNERLGGVLGPGIGIVGLFAKALSRLDNSPIERVSDTLAFESVDPARLAERLELQKNGQERGRKNEPPASTATFDSIEHTIITEIEEYRRKAVDRLTRELEAYSARLQAFDFEQARIDIISAINGATTEFIAEVHQGEGELHQKKRGVIGSTRGVENFQRKHRLDREAHPPESRLWIWGVLIVLFVVEGFLNGALFAGGLAGGFLEGASIAAGIAFLNVIVGFGVGLYVVRFLLYRNIIFRLLAAIGLALDLIVNAFFNLGVARFRTALSSADPDAALIAAFGIPPAEVFQRLHEIVGFQSYILIGVGILFHVATIFDGFKYDDPYPFYGKYWRRREQAETDYQETLEQLIQFLTGRRNQAIEEMQDASRTLASSRKLASRIIENRALMGQRFETYLDNLERIANQLLAFYREANRTTRTAPSPGHFSETWKFPTRESLASSASAAVFVDDDIAKRTQEDLERGIVNVGQAYVEAVTTYKKIETTLDEELYNGAPRTFAA